MIEAVLIKVSGWKELTTSDLVPDRPCDDIGLDLQQRCAELMAELDGVREFMVVAPGVKAGIDRLYAIGEGIEGFHDFVAKEFGNDPDDSAAAWKMLMESINKVLSDVRNLKGKQKEELTNHEAKQYGLWKQIKELLASQGRRHSMKAVYQTLEKQGQIQDGFEFQAFKRTVDRAKAKLGEGRVPKTDKLKGAGSIDKSRYNPAQGQDCTDDFQPDDD